MRKFLFIIDEVNKINVEFYQRIIIVQIGFTLHLHLVRFKWYIPQGSCVIVGMIKIYMLPEHKNEHDTNCLFFHAAQSL